MNKPKNSITWIALAVILSGTPWVGAVTWSGGTGGTGTSWNDPANWSSGALPQPTEEAYFSGNTGLSAGKIISLDSPQVFGQIQFNGTTVSCSIGSDSDRLNGNTLSLISVVRSGYPNGKQTIAADTVLLSDSIWNITSGGEGFFVTGNISGPGKSLTKTGVGVLTLKGTNTYDGGTTINEGTLELGHADSLGTTGLITFGGGALRFFNSADYSPRFSQEADQVYNFDVISGLNISFATPLTSQGGRLIKSGSGTLTLSAPNNYTGSTTLNSGLLTFSDSGTLGSTSANLTVAGGTLDLATASPLTVGTLFITGGGVITNGILTATSDYDIYTSANPTINAILAGSGIGLTKGNSGILTLANANTYTGNTTINGGTLTLGFNNSSSPVSDIVNSASSLHLGGGKLTLTGKNSTSLSQSFNGTVIHTGASSMTLSTGNATGSAILSLGALTRDHGGTITFSQPTGNTTLGANNGYTTTTENDATGILGGFATIGTTDWAANDGINVVAYTGYNTLSGETPSIVDDPTSNLRVNTSSTGDIGQASETVTVNSLLVNDTTARTVTIGSGNTLRLGALGGILKTGTGSLTLGAADGAGTLTAGGADNTPGELIFFNTDMITNNAVIADNGTGAVSLTKGGGGTLLLSNPSTFTGGTTLNAGLLQLPAGIDPLSPSSDITINSGTLDLGTATNTLSGTLTIRGGSITNGMLTITGTKINAEAGTIFAQLTGTAGLDKTTAGTLTFANNSTNTFTGTTTILRGTITAGTAADGVTIPGPLVVGSPLGGASATFRNLNNRKCLSPSKPITIYSNGTVDLGGGAQNLNGGSVTILGGTLTGKQVYIYAGCPIYMTGGTVSGNFYGGSYSITSYSNNTPAVVSVLQNHSVTYTVADGSSPVDLDFTGAAGGGSDKTLTKNGAGLMRLVGSSTYGGGTTINGGTLLVNNLVGSGTGSGAVTVKPSATLAGSGFIGGVVNYTNAHVTASGTSANPAILSPGSIDPLTGDHVIGTLTIGSSLQTNNVTMGAYSSLKIDFDTTGHCDKLVVNGTLSLNTTTDKLELNIPDYSALKSGTYTLATFQQLADPTKRFDLLDVPVHGVLGYTPTSIEYIVPSKSTLVIIQ